MTDAPVKTYSNLESAFVFFNRELFGGLLPRCLITYQRKKGALGYFSPGRFAKHDVEEHQVDEIAMNPSHFSGRPVSDVLSTLVHEMAHVWQSHYGEPSRGGYHNKQWATKMKEVGLIPSDTGAPGGLETGQRVSHYVAVDGPFDRACKKFVRTHDTLLFQDRASDPKKKKVKDASKTRYTCFACGLRAWAKPGVVLICGSCTTVMKVV